MGIYERLFGGGDSLEYDDPYIVGDGEDYTPNYIKDQRPIKGKSTVNIVSEGIDQFGRAVVDDPVGVAKAIGTGIYESGKNFVQNPVDTTTEFVSGVGESIYNVGTKSLTDYLPDGVTEETASEEQMTQARQDRLNDILNASIVVPAAGATTFAAKSLATAMPELEFDPNTVGMNLGNIKFNQKTTADSEIELPPASNSQRTQIAGTLPTYKKADALLTDLSGEGVTLDYGAGLGLSQKELGYDTLEPFPREGFEPTFNSGSNIPDGSYKRITNLNVLNVVPKETRDEIVKDIGRILQTDGTAIITTRGRDVLNAKGDAGPENMSLITSAGTYQKGFTQSELREYVQETLGDNFEVSNNKLGAAGVTIRKKGSETDELLGMSFGGADANQIASSGDNLVPFADPEFSPTGRISTRVPMQGSGKNKQILPETYSTNLTIGKKEMEEGGTLDKNLEFLATRREPASARPEYGESGDVPYFPGFKALEGMTPEQRASYVSAMNKENLNFIMDRLPDGFQDRAKLWYVGANRFSEELANKYGLPRSSVSGVIAALSPQMNWFKNASLAERVINAAIDNRNFPWSSEMTAVANKYPAFIMGDNKLVWETIRDKKYSELETTAQKAMWIRAYDEAHNPKTHREITPEGDLGEIILSKSGKPADIGWGGFGEIEKAVKSLESGGDYKIISDAMGDRHKVRNFFNNIEVPYSDMQDITVDTHAIAAAYMRPLAGTDTLTAQGLGTGKGSSSTPIGAKGMYGFIADDYRDVASDRGLLPRETQSISWEAVRSLFDGKSPQLKRKVNSIWSAFDRGDLTQQQALDLIEEASGGFGDLNKVLSPRSKRSIAAGSSTMFAAGGLAVKSEDEDEGFASPVGY